MIQVHGVGSGNDPAHDTEKDAALAVVGDVAQDIDPIVAKRVLRKIDLYFMPAMLIGMHTHFGNPNIQNWLKFYFDLGYGIVYWDKVCMIHISTWDDGD